MSKQSVRVGFVAVAALALAILTIAPGRAASSGGFNDFSCTPGPEHPNPVVLIHGFGSPGGESNFRVFGPALAAEKYCAFAVSYGHTSPLEIFGGMAPLDQSAEFIRNYIDQVLDATGASEADIVGHSEGGLHSLYVPKKYGLGDTIGTVVALAPPTHGLDFSGTLTVPRALGLPPLVKPVTGLLGCAACDELVIDESFIRRLNDGAIAQPGIDYTIIASRWDLLVTPTETSFAREPGVTNTLVQDICPLNVVGHIGMAYDAAVFQLVTNALDPAHASPVNCGLGGPPV